MKLDKIIEGLRAKLADIVSYIIILEKIWLFLRKSNYFFLKKLIPWDKRLCKEFCLINCKLLESVIKVTKLKPKT